MIVPIIPQIKITRQKIARLKEKKVEIRPGDASLIHHSLYKTPLIAGIGELSMEDFLMLKKMIGGTV
jgi:hypothetical protein